MKKYVVGIDSVVLKSVGFTFTVYNSDGKPDFYDSEKDSFCYIYIIDGEWFIDVLDVNSLLDTFSNKGDKGDNGDNYDGAEEDDDDQNTDKSGVKFGLGKYKMILLLNYAFDINGKTYYFNDVGFILDYIVTDVEFVVSNPVKLFLESKNIERITRYKNVFGTKGVFMRIYIVDDSVWLDNFGVKLDKKFNLYMVRDL